MLQTVVSENPRGGERAKPLWLEGKYGGSKMAKRAKLFCLGRYGDSKIMKSRQSSFLLDAVMEDAQRLWREGNTHSGWKSNKKVPRWPRGQSHSNWQLVLGPKICFSSKVPRDTERQ